MVAPKISQAGKTIENFLRVPRPIAVASLEQVEIEEGFRERKGLSKKSLGGLFLNYTGW